MSNRLKGWVFSAALVLASILLFSLSGTAWNRSGTHLALAANVAPRAGETQTLPLSTQAGSVRDQVEIPGAILSTILAGDSVRVKSRRIPFLNEEYLDCALVREGRDVASWSVGLTYYAIALAVAALAVAAVVTAIATLIGAVFRFQPLGTEE